MMKRILICGLLLTSCGMQAQTPYQSQAVFKPIYCSSTSSFCQYPVVYPGQTGIIVAVASDSGIMADDMGDGISWTRDFCIGGDHSCIWRKTFTSLGYPKVWFSGIGSNFPQAGHDVIMLLFQGPLGNPVATSSGGYTTENSAFPDCTNGGNCPYDWTFPVAVDAGTLLIAWSDPETSPGIPVAGPGWNIEANDGLLSIETMIAPVPDVPIIASQRWALSNGQPSGGSHWLMGLAAYKR